MPDTQLATSLTACSHKNNNETRTFRCCNAVEWKINTKKNAKFKKLSCIFLMLTARSFVENRESEIHFRARKSAEHIVQFCCCFCDAAKAHCRHDCSFVISYAFCCCNSFKVLLFLQCGRSRISPLLLLVFLESSIAKFPQRLHNIAAVPPHLRSLACSPNFQWLGSWETLNSLKYLYVCTVHLSICGE